MPLNDTKLRRIDGKPYEGPDELPDGGGLSARISPKGLITFQYRYRFGGKPVRLKLGVSSITDGSRYHRKSEGA